MTARVTLSSGDIEVLLDELGSRLKRLGIDAEIYVVGGSAIALTLAGRRTTHDVDAVVEPRAEVLDVARQMAHERGLPNGWLNTSATPFVPPRDPGTPARRTGALTVKIAPAEHLFAMKLVAGRDRDIDDIHDLADRLGICNAAEAADIALNVYGEGQLDMYGGYDAILEDAAMFLAAARREPPSQ